MTNKVIFLSALKTGLIVGALDAVAASVYSFGFFGSTPDKVFRYVASGVFGEAAFTGGFAIAACGLFFHFVVAIGWTGLFYLLYPKMIFFSSSQWMAGISYGIFIWVMMNFVVIPISNVPPAPFHFTIRTVVMILIHMFVIGCSITYFTNRFYTSK